MAQLAAARASERIVDSGRSALEADADRSLTSRPEAPSHGLPCMRSIRETGIERAVLARGSLERCSHTRKIFWQEAGGQGGLLADLSLPRRVVGLNELPAHESERVRTSQEEGSVGVGAQYIASGMPPSS